MKLKDGLPRKAFAYAPGADPATWKLPYRKADGTPDPDHLPGAAAALSEGGFRGQKADIPADAIATVKAKLRSAYRQWKGSAAEYPASIKETEYALREAEGDSAVIIREATVLLDKSSVTATVIQAPNGDTLVIPYYDGQFAQLAKPYVEPDAVDYDPYDYDISDAANMLSNLTRLRRHESDEPDQVAMIDAAIDGLTRFIRAEATEVKESDPLGLALATIEEVGKRNNASDQKTIQSMHDLTHDLGAGHSAGKSYPNMSVAEAAIEVDSSKPAVAIQFAEASADSPAFVMLSEAAATFDDDTRTVTITPIKPGFGNKRDGFYYPTQTLREATDAGLFNNVKMYRNHPRKSDEKDLPERDVNDWFATTREATWDDSLGRPRLPVKVHDPKDYDRWKEAPEQIAFSVRGGGMARDGRAEGQETKILESLVKVRSVDWVTEAGAGGAIDFAESAASEEFEMDLKKFTADQLREELRIREADGGTAVADKTDEKVDDKAVDDKAKAETPNPTPPNPTPTPTPTPPTPSPVASGAPEAEKAPDGYVSKADFDEFVKRMESKAENDKKAADAAAEVREAAAKAVAAEVAESILPKRVKDLVVADFAEAGWGEGAVYTDEPALRGAVKGALAKAAAMVAASRGLTPSPVKGLGAEPPDDGEKPTSAVIAESIGARWGDEQFPTAFGGGIYTPEQLAQTTNVTASAAAEAPERAVPVAEAAASTESSIAARMGI